MKRTRHSISKPNKRANTTNNAGGMSYWLSPSAHGGANLNHHNALLNLPDEVLATVLAFLDGKTLVACRKVSTFSV